MFQLALTAPKGGPSESFCHFCRKMSATDEGIWVEDRGRLCRDCINAIRAVLTHA